MQDEIMDKTGISVKEPAASLSRRRFLTYAGLLAGAGVFAASCGKDEKPEPITSDDTLDVGSEDIGVINFLYAHEQLAAVFYDSICGNPYVDMGNNIYFYQDILAHTLAHRELLKELLGADAIPELEISVSDINFNSPIDVLAYGATLSDILVMGYNVAIPQLVSGTYRSIAEKISSVKARHSAFVRDLQSFGSFTNSDTNGQEVRNNIRTLLSFTNGRFNKKLTANNLV